MKTFYALTVVLSMAVLFSPAHVTIRDIEDNAMLQGMKSTPEEMLRGFIYYLENEAFY